MTATEYEHVENKQSLNEWREIVESVAAFVTAQGGLIRIGIDPSGKRVGVQLGQRSLENLADQIKNNTEPPQYPSLTVAGEESAAIVALRVEESPIKPVWAFGRPYKRVGRTNQRLSPEETRRLMEITSGRTWDALICPGFALADVDRQAAEEFLRKAGQDASGSTEAVLQNLGLLTSEGLSYGAALLFAENPQRFIPGAQVKCARFLGLTSVDFLDEQTLDESVLSQVERAVAFVLRNTRQGIRFTGRPERETVPEYPAEAVREAVTNAACHRDYTAAGTVQVRIYDDRLEVWNPGTLPPTLTIEALYREHASHPRNRLLANAFYRARLIEHWGTGTLRIVQACQARGMPRPEFLSQMGMFIVRFRKLEAETVLPDFSGLNDRQKQAIGYVRRHGRITSAEYRALFQLGISQTKEDLAGLVQAAILTRRGRGPATEYVLATGDDFRPSR